tara:strand:+ start:5296 stop:6192 length:897 start_codon:yes stop_codon:yes gene_type:complete
MSRNSKRTSAQEVKTQAPQAPAPSNPGIPPNFVEQNPFGLSFVVSTETVFLPSCGLLYNEESPLHGVESIEVKALTAVEEDILTNRSYVEQGTVFDKLIDSIIIGTDAKAKDFLECDKMAILMSARKTGYGDEVEFTTSCDSCDEVVDFKASLSKILEDNKNASTKPSTSEEWEYSEQSNTFSFKLPITGLPVKIRLLSPRDLLTLDQAKKQKEKLGLPFIDSVEFIRMVLVEAAGIVDLTNLNKLAEVLPARDVRKIRSIHNKVMPSMETKQTVECPSCHAIAEKEVPFSLGWFWAE